MALTDEQKKLIDEIILKKKIYVLDDIATLADLPRGDVRNYIRRMFGFREIIRCPFCNKEIIITYHNPQKRFCNPEHKRLYYNTHRKKTQTSICKCCGKEYQHYSFRDIGFCSLSCKRKYKIESANSGVQKSSTGD